MSKFKLNKELIESLTTSMLSHAKLKFRLYSFPSFDHVIQYHEHQLASFSWWVRSMGSDSLTPYDMMDRTTRLHFANFPDPRTGEQEGVIRIGDEAESSEAPRQRRALRKTFMRTSGEETG
jgi:hypothetical protein